MGNIATNAIAKNLRVPQKGLVGRYVSKLLIKKNSLLEVNAARLCDITRDQHVLEIGFGPGIGLQAAYQYVKDESGKIHGLDISAAMVELASKQLAHEIASGKVELRKGSVDNLPYKDDTFDAVFHCNCYYFWPDQLKAAKEIYRVIKSNSCMVTTVDIAGVKEGEKNCFLKYGNGDHERYMASLREAGFEDVHIIEYEDNGYIYQAIYAKVDKKS